MMLQVDLMHKIENKDYGLYITFTGRVCHLDLYDWFEESEPIILKAKKHFSVIFDFKDAKPLCLDTARALTYFRAYLLGKGSERVAIVYSTSATLVELMKMLQELGKHRNEVHISVPMNSNWKERAELWVRDGVAP